MQSYNQLKKDKSGTIVKFSDVKDSLQILQNKVH